MYPADTLFRAVAWRAAGGTVAAGPFAGLRLAPHPFLPHLLGSYERELHPTIEALAARAWDGLFADPELDMKLAQTIHADQSFRWTRPLRAGDEVTATLRIDKLRARGASAFVTVAVTLATTDSEAICEAVSTLLHTWPKEDA